MDASTATHAPPRRLAAVASSWRHGGGAEHLSHAQVLLTRWLTPRPADRAWGWPGPRGTALASIYVEQLHADDAVHALCAAHDVRLADSIEDALTLGGRELAVDGVLLIGEHGHYPRNELGQKLYPRKAYFDQIVAVFERSDRGAPVFCDKHFSWNFTWAQQMVATAGRTGFLLFGGSSVPHCALAPPLPSFQSHPPREVVAIYSGDVESYGFHSMEMVQALVEHRPGGETGVRRVTTYEGSSLTEAMQRGEWSPALFHAATQAACDPQQRERVQVRTAMVADHADGLRVAHVHVSPSLGGWALAVRCGNEAQPRAARAVMGGRDDFQAHFATLARVIEQAMCSGEAPFPVERTLLATGTLAAAMRGRAQPGQPIEDPRLLIRYTPRRGTDQSTAPSGSA